MRSHQNSTHGPRGGRGLGQSRARSSNQPANQGETPHLETRARRIALFHFFFAPALFFLSGCGDDTPKAAEDASDIVEAPPGEFCAEGSERTQSCGEDERGTQIERCVDGVWIADACIEPHACLANPDLELACEEETPSGSVMGIRRGACVDGEWVDELAEDGKTRCQLFSQVAASEGAFCALRTTGEVLCWGNGEYGQTGRADHSSSSAPTKVEGIDDAIAISGNENTFCALRPNGEVLCWGRREHNGQEVTTHIPSPVLYRESSEATPLPIDDAISLDGGWVHTCVVRRSGGALCWGNNGGRRMGTNLVDTAGDAPIANPVLVDSLESEPLMGIKTIAAGRYNSCASLQDGKVVCWGSNNEAALGAGNACPGQFHFPCETVGIDDALRVYTGGLARNALIASCALHADGSLSCWGQTRHISEHAYGAGTEHHWSPELRIAPDHQLGAIVDLTISSHHVCAIFDNGKLGCWGAAWAGRLGNGDDLVRDEPELVLGVGGEGELEGVIHVDSKRGTTCAVIDHGRRVACWGADNTFQLGHGGDGTMVESFLPRLIDWPVCQEGATRAVHCGLNGRGENLQTCSGSRWEGQCDDPDICADGSEVDISCTLGGTAGLERRICVHGQPSTLHPETNQSYACETLDAIGAGREHSCALRTTGEVLCWGSNVYGQLGVAGGDRSSPVAVPGLSDIVALSVGDDHNCALRENGRVQCWGRGADGRLGHGSNADSHEPITVINLVDAIAVSAGAEHSCAVNKSGEALCWGKGANGRLGDGGDASTNIAVGVEGLNEAIAISAGREHSCAVRRDGSVFCWGAGGSGRLGNGNDRDASTPVPVIGVDESKHFIGVAARGRHSCAFTESGEAFCWGAGELGQLGSGFTSVHAIPVPVSFPPEASNGGEPPRIVELSAGLNHSCARLGAGEAWCWGVAQNGVLGSPFPGASPRALAPTKMPTDIESGTGAYDVRSIAAGNGHSCAILMHPSSGESVGACTGAGGRGRLGTGDTVNVDQLEPIDWQ